jgi:asparagine synthase (glutamine-hydrolysing)
MCGITVFFGDRTVANLDMYFKRGSKRGPEEYVYECNDDVHMGFHRLAINGIEKGTQPLHYKQFVLVCNGEIYNYKYLIDKYQLPVNTGSDCEVILHLYDLFREKCLELLDGEFAFVIHDRSTGEIFAARDPFGVRPLYINEIQQSFCLSSDLYPMTFNPLMDVKQFSPGFYSRFKPNDWGYERTVFKRYHQIELVPTSHLEVYNRLIDAVEKRVQNTDRPVACLLSGGLDSSVVAALAARAYAREGKVLETYSIGLQDSEDLKHSSKVAEHIGSNHTQIVCTDDEFYDSIPQVIRDIESYDTTTVRASVGNWNVAKYIKQHSEAKVVLNGDGADELMGGYLYFHACPSHEAFDEECRRLLNHIYYFDVLRSDKSISSHGLEARTPYLDKAFVNAYMSLPVSERFTPGRMEKSVIRNIIATLDPDLLPRDILFRRKEAFSDGVSGLSTPWYKTIQSRVPVFEYPCMLNNPTTSEQKYYRVLFDKYYKNCDNLVPYFWMPRFVEATDASARTLKMYHSVEV